MNWVDWLIIIALLFYIFDGFRRGFFELVLEFFSFSLATFLALEFDKPVGRIFATWLGVPESFDSPVGFLIIWFGAQLIFTVAIRVIYKFIPAELRKSIWNRIIGTVPSLAKGLILTAVVLLLFVTLPIPKSLKESANSSLIGGRIIASSALMEGALNRVFGGSLEDMVTFLTTEKPVEANPGRLDSRILAPDQRLELGFKTNDVALDEVSERRMLELINLERRSRGLGTLVADSELQSVARQYAGEMLARGYFSHISLEGKSPFDRMQEAGVEFKVAGENLALAPNVELAHNGLMNSPGHKANILEERFGRIGIGIIDGGIYGKMFVQNFRD